MRAFKTLLCALALVVAAQPSGGERDNDALLAKITAEISRREPGMKLSEQTRVLLGGKGIVESNKAEPEGTFQTWKGAGGESVVFLLFMEGTREKAAEIYQSIKTSSSAPSPRLTLLDTKVGGAGEEAHAWRGGHPQEFVVAFRKGRFAAEVSALSLETARRFASHLADALPDR
jgi:hypothetical protein